MSEMVERVARAICKDRFLGDGDDDGWDSATPEMQEDYRGNARAAIEAMREPTHLMRNAGFRASPYDVAGCLDQISPREWRSQVVPEIYKAMIDVALK